MGIGLTNFFTAQNGTFDFKNRNPQFVEIVLLAIPEGDCFSVRQRL